MDRLTRIAVRTSADNLLLQERIANLCDICDTFSAAGGGESADVGAIGGAIANACDTAVAPPVSNLVRFQLRDNCNRLKSCAEKLNGPSGASGGGPEVLDEIRLVLHTISNVLKR